MVQHVTTCNENTTTYRTINVRVQVAYVARTRTRLVIAIYTYICLCKKKKGGGKILWNAMGVIRAIENGLLVHWHNSCAFSHGLYVYV